MKEMIAVVMASTGLDAKTARERLEKALAEFDYVPEYAAVIAPATPRLALAKPVIAPATPKPDEVKP